jgi:hypothetical protein
VLCYGFLGWGFNKNRSFWGLGIALGKFIGRYRGFIGRFVKFVGCFSDFIGRFGIFIGQSPKITSFDTALKII